jgi:hypothetical protein
MIDEFLKKQGTGIALLFMVISLAYVNTLSLEYMYDNNWFIDIFFGIISAIAFSIVTILVMRLSKREWLKYVFPLFDAFLMFCGFNLRHWNDLFDNPVRFALSIVLSLFSGLITYSIGQINAEIHSDTSSETKIATLEKTVSHLNNQLLLAESKIKTQEQNLLEFKPGYLLYERSRILKKRVENRTERDLMILAESETLNN